MTNAENLSNVILARGRADGRLTSAGTLYSSDINQCHRGYSLALLARQLTPIFDDTTVILTFPVKRDILALPQVAR